MEINLMYLRTFRIFDDRNRILEQNVVMYDPDFSNETCRCLGLIKYVERFSRRYFLLLYEWRNEKNFRLFVEVNIHLEGTFNFC